MPALLPFITQFATGGRCVSAPCIQLVGGIANGIGKPVHLESWISDHSQWSLPSSVLSVARASAEEVERNLERLFLAW